jgi:predicted DsbA family dithiol-disulfide isomerase
MTNFDIRIVSDTVCPWCYVGKNKLERGIAAYKSTHPGSKDTFSTTWCPFYLNPHAPKTGIDKREYYKSKFGDDSASMIFERLGGVGKEVGINFSFGGKTGNTRDSHRLVQLGKTKSAEVQTRVVEELFKSYFEKEKDITSHETLREAGVKAGLEGEEVEEWLKSDKGGAEVDKEVAEAQMRGVSGVPNFVLQEKYEIGGAQDPNAFVRVFEKVKAMEGS